MAACFRSICEERVRTGHTFTVYCDSVYFDDIQLVRESIETNLSASDFTVEAAEAMMLMRQLTITRTETDVLSRLPMQTAIP